MPPVATREEGLARAAAELAKAGIARAEEIVGILLASRPMRGAMLLDADTLEHLEPDPVRGVRATYMDSDRGAEAESLQGKNHYMEAMVLAAKVQNAPGIVGEICISDDPDYVTGYVATRGGGYCRISKMKERGDPHGGRIFLYRGRREDMGGTIEYLERRRVVVTGIKRLDRSAATGGGTRFDDIWRELDAIEKAGLMRTCTEVDSPAGPRAVIGGREVVVLASNDYLDLARDPRLAAAAKDAAVRYGTGSGGSRLTTGTQPPHVLLEKRVAEFKGCDAAITFATGYMANLGVISALADKRDVIFSDRLNHASIIDGCRLSGARIVVYDHLDMDDLDRKMSASASGHRRRIVVSDGVFSMDGDVLDLPRFLETCRRHDAFSVVDEAHATGVVGETGRGLAELFKESGCGHPDVTIGTFSKALGGEGGFACAEKGMVEYLRNRARPFIFSTASSAIAAAVALEAIELLVAEPWRVERLRENARFFVEALAGHGIRANAASAIIPIRIGDERRAVEVSKALLRAGFYVPAIRYPTVAKGEARLRVAVMSAHEKSDLAAAAAIVARLI